jgi:hypothetical protein
MQDKSTENVSFDAWALLELFGHLKMAGRVTEQTIAGQGFVRIDVPETENQPGFTRLFGPNAIYSITPVSEDIARAFCARNSSQPIQQYELRSPEKDDVIPF